MQQSLELYRRPSYLGEDHIAIPRIQARPQLQMTASLYEYEPFAPPPPPWWQRWFPFLAAWLPWIVYYRDLSVYHTQRTLYHGHYLLAYTVWMLGRYRDAVQFHVRRSLYDLDDRLRRWAEAIERTEDYFPRGDPWK